MNYKAAFASINIAIAVALGALGAHALTDVLSASSLASFQTGIRYHLFHALALLVFSVMPSDLVRKSRAWSVMAVGMLFFSLSIYLLACKGLLGLEAVAPVLGPITPIGGVILIGAWVWLSLLFVRKTTKD